MTTTAGPKTIARTSARRIAAVKAAVTTCKVYTLSNYFSGAEIAPERAWEFYAKGSGKLLDNGNGTYTISVHSNCWYELA